jgi:hypothetical protein
MGRTDPRGMKVPILPGLCIGYVIIPDGSPWVPRSVASTQETSDAAARTAKGALIDRRRGNGPVRWDDALEGVQ